MGKRPYMLLLSLSKDNAASGKRVLDNIKSRIDDAAKPLWFDAGHIGIVMNTDMPACDIWRTAFITARDAESFNDVLILAIGDDWAARSQTTYTNWLSTHLGLPMPSKVHRR